MESAVGVMADIRDILHGKNHAATAAGSHPQQPSRGAVVVQQCALNLQHERCEERHEVLVEETQLGTEHDQNTQLLPSQSILADSREQGKAHRRAKKNQALSGVAELPRERRCHGKKRVRYSP